MVVSIGHRSFDAVPGETDAGKQLRKGGVVESSQRVAQLACSSVRRVGG